LVRALPGRDRPIDGHDVFAGLALDELEAHGLAGLQPLQQRRVRGLELHRHRRPLQRRDRAVVEAQRAGLEVDAVDGAFGLVADHGRCRHSGCPGATGAGAGAAPDAAASVPFAGLPCPACPPRPPTTAFRLLSASIRKFAATTTCSPSLHALEDLDVVLAARAEFDLTRLEPAFPT
jgi:hypothetical protein